MPDIVSRSEKAKKNISLSFAQMIIKLIVSLVGRMVFVRYLDASYLGINGLFINVIGVLSMADLGMTTAMMYHLYDPIAQGDQLRIARLVAFFKRVYLVIAGMVLLLGLMLVPFLHYIVVLPEELPGVRGYYVLTLLNTVISYLFIYRTTLVTADQKNYLLVRCNVAFIILTFVAQTAVLVLTRNYALYLAIALILAFANNLWQNRIATKLYPFLKTVRKEKLDKQYRSAIFDDIKSTFIYRVSGVIQTNTDSILTSIFVGTIAVGYYSNYVMIVTQVTNLITLVFNNLKAGIGNVIASVDGRDNEYELYSALELLNYWLVCFSAISMLCLSPEFVRLCFGDEYVFGTTVTIVIVVNFYTSNIRQTIWAFREATGIFRQTRYVTAVTAAINLILSLAFAPFFGLIGILVATVIARMVYSWWKEPKVLFEERFQRSPLAYYIMYFKRLGLCVMLCALTWLICNAIPLSGPLLLFAQALICLLLPNGAMFLIYRRSSDFAFLWNHIVSARLSKK